MGHRFHLHLTEIGIPLLGDNRGSLLQAHTRWKLLDTEFYLDTLKTALGGGRKLKVVHSDQSCQFTSSFFMARPQAEEI